MEKEKTQLETKTTYKHKRRKENETVGWKLDDSKVVLIQYEFEKEKHLMGSEDEAMYMCVRGNN